MISIEPGRLVISKAGRDKGRKFLILQIADKDYVYISDGSLRKKEKPKKKKIKHLAITGIVADTVKSKIETNKDVENYEIKNFLKSLEEKNKQEV